MKITVNYGDAYGDGHRHHDSATYEVNVEKSTELWDAYNKGTNLIGFNLVDDVCAEYEENTLDEEKAFLFKKALPNSSLTDFLDNGTSWDPMPNQNGSVSIEADTYLALFFEICKLGKPDLVYSCAISDSIDIGGYGLFGH